MVKMEEDRDKPWNFHTCKLCSYRSKSTFLMCKHARLHRTRSKTDTFICDANTPELFECEICEFQSNLKVDLTEHSRVFHEEKEVNELLESIFKCYYCRHCLFETHSLLMLMKHVGNCSSVFRRNSSKKPWNNRAQNYHIETGRSEDGKRFKCEHCAYKSKQKSYLKRHVTAKHTNSENIAWSKCKQCAFKCKDIYYLKYHFKIKHGKPEDIRWFKCEQCTYKSKKNGTLLQHMNSKHVNPEDIKWFKCEQCAFKTKRNDTLKRHVLKHADPKSVDWFKCHYCAFKGKEKRHLTRHITWKHTKPEDINWFKCGKCTFKCKERGSVKRHVIAKHTSPEDINWFKCAQCAFKSKQKCHLQRHIVRHANLKSTVNPYVKV